MIGLRGLLTVYLLFAVFGFVVLAAFTVSRSLRGKVERGQPRKRQRNISSEPRRLPPGAYPPEVHPRQPAPTVTADQAQAVQSAPTADEPIDAEIVDDVSDEEEAADLVRTTPGTDDKTYTASPPIPPKPTASAASVSNAELRRWAKDCGLRVADRGPIPGHVREAWAKANR
jgi:hypothetical protein